MLFWPFSLLLVFQKPHTEYQPPAPPGIGLCKVSNRLGT